MQGCEKLIKAISDQQKSVKSYICADELFQVLYSTHQAIGHGGRDRMLKELNLKYKNITQAQIKIFLELCESCQKNIKVKKRNCC